MRITTADDDFLVRSGAQADGDDTVEFETRVDFRKLGHRQQNTVPLVQQLGRLFAHALNATQLGVHPGQLLRQSVDLVDVGLDRFFGFGIDQVELCRQLAEA